MTLAVYTRTPRLTVQYGSTVGVAPDTTLANVLSARVSLGFDQRVATATVVFPGPVEGTGIDFWTQISVACDAGSWSPAAAPVRFLGYVTRFDYTLWPRSVSLACKGKLVKITQVIAQLDSDDPDTPGIALAGMTDQAQVRYGLDQSGLSGAYTSGDILGTGITLGSETAPRAKGAAAQFVWGRRQTFLAYLDNLEAATLGFRTFETLGGQIVRRFVSKRPTTAAITGAKLFTEGVDIERAGAGHDVEEAANRIVVPMYDDGKAPLRYVATAGHPHPMPGVSYVTYTLPDGPCRLIERQLDSDAGDGLSCQQVAEWLLVEKNHVRLSVDFTTPRDALIGPGDTIAVGASDRLEVYQNFWVQNVGIEVTEAGQFSQTFKCVAPAAVGRGGAALPTEAGIYGFTGLGNGLGIGVGGA